MEQLFPAVKAVIKKKGSFLIVKQIVGNEEFWDLPGGKVAYGESPYDALHREVKEETGMEIEILNPVGIWWFFRDDKNQVVCTTFICRTKNEEIDIRKNLDKDENIAEYRWVTKEEFLNGDYPVSNKSLKDIAQKF